MRIELPRILRSGALTTDPPDGQGRLAQRDHELPTETLPKLYRHVSPENWAAGDDAPDIRHSHSTPRVVQFAFASCWPSGDRRFRARRKRQSPYEVVAAVMVFGKPLTPRETVSSTAKFNQECDSAKALKLLHQSTTLGSVAGLGWFALPRASSQHASPRRDVETCD